LHGARATYFSRSSSTGWLLVGSMSSQLTNGSLLVDVERDCCSSELIKHDELQEGIIADQMIVTALTNDH